MKRGGGAAQCLGSRDQQLECGADLRRAGGADGVSCVLAPDSAPGGGL
jgi:hypothetical protein